MTNKLKWEIKSDIVIISTDSNWNKFYDYLEKKGYANPLDTRRLDNKCFNLLFEIWCAGIESIKN